MSNEFTFASAASMFLPLSKTEEETDSSPSLDTEHFSVSGKTSPLDFLAHASMTMDHTDQQSRWLTKVSDGRERITVLPGPAGSAVRLHKGNGRLPPVDLSKPFARKCRNRECNNLGGQEGKPRSIYCSKRCQSREQNLRQGRIKNIRTGSGDSPFSSKSPAASTGPTAQGASRHTGSGSSSSSPRSSPSDSMTNSSASPVPPSSPPVSPVLLETEEIPSTFPLSVPSQVIPSPLSFGSIGGFSLSHTFSPSPLTIRLGMTPSPISMSPSPICMASSGSGFSPVPMSSAIPTNQLNSTPIFLPKPAQVRPNPNPSGFSKLQPTTPIITNNKDFQSNSSFSRPNTSHATPASPSTDNSLTLAPIRD